MNEQTTQLIEKLAAKLGTTAEYLWAVLIAQAPVQATIAAVWLLIIIVMIAIFLPLGNRYRKAANWSQESPTCYLCIISYVIAGCFTIALMCTFCGRITDIITGFYNPEYWALQQVLNLR